MNSWADDVEMAARENLLAEYLAQFFPGRFGIGVRRPMGRTYKRMGNQGERPKVVVGHSYVDRIGRADSPEEGDNLEVNWLGFAGASIQQLLTIVYEMIDGEYKYLSSQFVVIGWENSVINGLTLDEAEAIINGVVEEQRGLTTHRIILAECAMSPRIIKLGKSQVAFRINRMVKEAARRSGAHRLDLERSVGKVDARKEVVGVKHNMWAEHGTDGYHPSEQGAGRMAVWLRNYFRHGMDASDPEYPPKKPKEPEVKSTPPVAEKPEAAQGSSERRKLTRRELLDALKRARGISKSPDDDSLPSAKRRQEELVMDTDEEMEVDRRTRVVLEPEGEDLSEKGKVVHDLITIEEDPVEGPSGRCMVPEVAHGAGSVGSVASSAGAAHQLTLELEEEEDLSTLESYFDGTRKLIRSVNAARRRVRAEKELERLPELQRDFHRKRTRLAKHLQSLAQVALEAAQISADDSSSSSSSSDSESEKKVVKKKKDTSYQAECRRLARTMDSVDKAREQEKTAESAEKKGEGEKKD